MQPVLMSSQVVTPCVAGGCTHLSVRFPPVYPLFPAGKARHENITTEKAKAKVKDLTVGTIRSLACNPLREAVFPMRVSPEWHFQGGGVPVPLPGLPFPCVGGTST